MTKVEINGKTYCVETLIYEVERLTKDVKASAEYHRLVLEQIRAEIEETIESYVCDKEENTMKAQGMLNAMQMTFEIIDKYKAESEK